jgi:ribosomal protein S18 acetylase RimI-like enzyme
MQIRKAQANDAPAIVEIILPVIREGTAYALDRDLSEAERGVARSMCEHSLAYASSRGYRAMQFNFVISTNERAVRLWQSLGFETVGRLPEAFRHPVHGYVDALVMYRLL